MKPEYDSLNAPKGKKKRRKLQDEPEIVISKKMNKKVTSNNDVEVDDLQINTTITGQGKKKKRKLHEDKEHEVADCTVDEEDELSLTLASPLKKLKKERDLKEVENKLLLECALEQLKPNRKAYAAQLNKLDYDKIATRFEDKTAQQCKEHIKLLIEKIPKTKCLHQIIGETLTDLPSRKRKCNSFSIFIMQNLEQINKAIQEGRGKNKIGVASLLWNELTAEERWKYQQQSSTYIDGQSSSCGKTPMDVFLSHLKKKKNGQASLFDARKKWSTLSVSKKVKFIEKSIEVMRQIEDVETTQREIEEEEGEGEEGGGEVASLPSKGKKGPTKADIQIYLKFLNIPEMPDKTPALFYYKKSFNLSDHPSRSLLLDAVKAFKTVEQTKKEKWLKKFNDVWASYKEKMKAWKEEQNQNTIYIVEKEFSEAKPKLKKQKKTEKSDTIQTLVSSLHKIEMPISNIKFKSEMCIPPLTAVQLFAKEMTKGGEGEEKVNMNEVRKRFSGLKEKEKEKFEANCVKIRGAYVKNLVSMVSDMPKEQQKLFLGLKREKYIKVLKEDVFALVYPSNKFPLYVRSLKGGKGKEKEKKESSDETSDTEEDEDGKGNSSPKKGSAKSSDSDSDSDNSEITVWTSSLKQTKMEETSDEDEDSDSDSDSD